MENGQFRISILNCIFNAFHSLGRDAITIANGGGEEGDQGGEGGGDEGGGGEGGEDGKLEVRPIFPIF